MAPSVQPIPTCVSDEKYANVKWEELGFGFFRTDNMYVAKCNHGESFQEGSIVPYADLQISPCSAVLNSGFWIQEERVVPIEDLLDSQQVFCTGTAAIVTSIASVTFKNKKTGFQTGEKNIGCEALCDVNGYPDGSGR